MTNTIGRREALRIVAGGIAGAGLAPSIIPTPAAAAVTTNHRSRPRPSHPKLFGLRERLLPHTPTFRQRRQILRSWQQITASARPSTAVDGFLASDKWLAMLDDVRGAASEAQLDSVNKFVNSTPYVSDERRFRKSDFWALPSDFLSGGGDCEDYVITKYISLRWLGFHPDRLRVVLGRLPKEGIYHAILTAYLNGPVLVLDNRVPQIVTQEIARRYFVPTLSMNEREYWLHFR